MPSPLTPEIRILSPKGQALVISFEVSSPEYYTKALAKPTWPGLSSGITIGIGEDLGFYTIPELLTKWEELSFAKYFIPALGVTGAAAQKLVPKYSQYTISWEIALSVFLKYTVPDYFKKTESIFYIKGLPHDIQSALWATVYNRGTSLTGDSRKEMAAIATILQSYKNNLLTVPDVAVKVSEQLKNMTRLWPNVKGLQNRYIATSQLVATYTE